MIRIAPLLAALLLAASVPAAQAYGPSSPGEQPESPPDQTPSSEGSGNTTPEEGGEERGDPAASNNTNGTRSSTNTTTGNATEPTPSPPPPDPEESPDAPSPRQPERDADAPPGTGNRSADADDAARTAPDGPGRNATRPTPTPERGDAAPPGGREEAGRGRPDEAGRVVVRDTRGGFETVPAEPDLRPAVQVDVRAATLRVERPGVAPLTTNLVGLLEFEDADGDGAYDLGERVVASHDLRARDPVVMTDGENATRDVVYELEPGARLTLRFELAPPQDGVGAKFDVVIEGYRFASPTTRLALGALVEAAGELRATQVEGAPAVASVSGGEASYLSWVEHVDVDGVEHAVAWSVHASLSPDDASAIVYWAYPQGARIVHDPALGVMGVARELLAQPTAFALGLAATFAVLITGYAARRRMGR